MISGLSQEWNVTDCGSLEWGIPEKAKFESLMIALVWDILSLRIENPGLRNPEFPRDVDYVIENNNIKYMNYNEY